MTRETGPSPESGAAVGRIAPGEREALEALLREAGLPLDGLRDHLETTVVARRAGRIVASAAIEPYGRCGLLRSVAVDPAERGRGLGVAITRAALDVARELGITEVYLLTETASTFFPRLGFVRVERADIPPEVQASVEFTTACPASAVAMAARHERVDRMPDDRS